MAGSAYFAGEESVWLSRRCHLEVSRWAYGSKRRPDRRTPNAPHFALAGLALACWAAWAATAWFTSRKVILNLPRRSRSRSLARARCLWSFREARRHVDEFAGGFGIEHRLSGAGVGVSAPRPWALLLAWKRFSKLASAWGLQRVQQQLPLRGFRWWWRSGRCAASRFCFALFLVTISVAQFPSEVNGAAIDYAKTSSCL